MKVFDLHCEKNHVFEGWFANAAAFDDQQQRQLLRCPVCDSLNIRKGLSAPRLNLGHAQAPAPAKDRALSAAPQPMQPATRPPTHAADAPTHETLQRMQAAWIGAVREMVARTEDVGERFVDEALKIHHGEAEARPIRGQASEEQREALEAEGIETVAMTIPKDWLGPVQ